MIKRNSFFLYFTFITLVTAFLCSSTFANVTTNCYKAADDYDGDGYAKSGSTPVSVNKPKNAYCPSGYVLYANDCDDRNKNVHPYNTEAPANGLDDNCNGSIDEPELTYSTSTSRVTSSSIKLYIKINHIYGIISNTLYAKVQYRTLKNDTVTDKFYRIYPSNFVNYSTSRYADRTISGLSGTTAYRFRVALYWYKNDGSKFYITDKNGNSFSEWFYSTTTGYSYKNVQRTKIVLKALYEYGQSQIGKVGYAGTSYKDGTKYDASLGEWWCSEFYAWATKSYIVNMSGKDSVSDIIDYFSAYGTLYSRSTVKTGIYRGDYLAIGDTGSSTEKTHSGMFLAYDSGNHIIWSVEGNVGNKVKIKQRDYYNYEIKKAGYITDSMLK